MLFLKRMRFFPCVLLASVLCATAANAAQFRANGDIIGNIRHYKVKKSDNLYAIARRFDIGIVELLAANPGVDPWLPEPGTELTLSTMHVLPQAVREGIVINLSELRLFYYENDTVLSFPIGIGREGWETPIGATTIVSKRRNPTWTPPASIREENPNLPEVVAAGPDNPLGAFAMNTGWSGYIIHGTNRPYGIGKRSSHGCIRLYPEDISRLFEHVETGTRVTIVDAPYKLGWKGDDLYLEVTPTQQQADEIAAYRQVEPVSIPEIYLHIREFAGEDAVIDWYELEETVSAHTGIPAVVGHRAVRSDIVPAR